MKWVNNIYNHIWFYTEFWVNQHLRRPFTFIVRDYAHNHPVSYIIINVGLTGLLIYWIDFRILLVLFYGLLLGHFSWANYTKNEQENPEFLG